MSRLTLHSILFTVGFGLAFLSMHGIHLIAKNRVSDSKPLRAGISSEPSISNRTEYINNKLNGADVTSRPSLSTKIQHINSGIRSNNPNAIRLLHPDVLNDFPGDELDKYLPQLKNEILRKLVIELSRSDWLQWGSSETDNRVAKTSARKFIDNLRAVNFNLGRYAETAALLFSGLYYTTASGRLFSVEEELYNLMIEADQLFKQRTPAAFSARVYLDYEITEDTNFQIWLERLRAKFVVDFCLEETRQIEAQFYLLSSIKEEYHNDSVIRIYEVLLGKVSSRITPRFREELRTSYLAPAEAKRMMSLMPEISDMVEKFYQKSFEDKILLGDKAKARSVFLQYSSLFPESNTLSEYQNEIARLDSDDAVADNKLASTFEETENQSYESEEIKEGRRGTFSFVDGGISTSGKLVSKIEQAGLLIIVILALGLFFRKRWSLLIDRFQAKRAYDASKSKARPNNVEPIDRSPRLRSVTRGKVRSHEGSKKKVVNN
jgi:hypothetical protein